MIYTYISTNLRYRKKLAESVNTPLCASGRFHVQVGDLIAELDLITIFTATCEQTCGNLSVKEIAAIRMVFPKHLKGNRSLENL